MYIKLQPTTYSANSCWHVCLSNWSSCITNFLEKPQPTLLSGITKFIIPCEFALHFQIGNRLTAYRTEVPLKKHLLDKPGHAAIIKEVDQSLQQPICHHVSVRLRKSSCSKFKMHPHEKESREHRDGMDLIVQPFSPRWALRKRWHQDQPQRTLCELALHITKKFLISLQAVQSSHY